MKQRSVAIVGAGVAGLACARRLAASSVTVRLFDKGRAPGGRLATRRVVAPDGGEIRFDHGAQYITARDPAFAAVLDALGAQGAAQRWSAEIAELDGFCRPLSGVRGAMPARWIGMPGMSGLARGLASGLDVAVSSRVSGIARSAAGWRIAVARDDGVEEAGPFDALVVAVPAEQAVALLEPLAADIAAQARAAVTAPCWAGLFVFETSIGSPFSAARFTDHDALAWVACEQGKRDRPGPEAWVAHATPDWSRRHLEESAEEVAAALLSAFRAMHPAAPAPIFSQAHRWRYAQVAQAAGTPFAWDAVRGLGVCGDWRLGPRVEAAWLSGDGLGAAMLA